MFANCLSAVFLLPGRQSKLTRLQLSLSFAFVRIGIAIAPANPGVKRKILDYVGSDGSRETLCLRMRWSDHRWRRRPCRGPAARSRRQDRQEGQDDLCEEALCRAEGQAASREDGQLCPRAGQDRQSGGAPSPSDGARGAGRGADARRWRRRTGRRRRQRRF